MLPFPHSGVLLFAIWVIWTIYWFVPARKVKSIQKRESRLSQLGSAIPIWIAAYLLFGYGVPDVLRTRLVDDSLATAVYWSGVAIEIGGFLFTVWARRVLGTNWSVVAAQKESHELIQSGPYAMVRHPIYAGFLVAILGAGIATAEWRGVAAALSMAVAMAIKAHTEEGLMQELFPDAYAAYRARVKALIPGIY